jgi:hypothetical protein
VELGQYRQVPEGFFAPSIIRIIKPAAEGGEGSVSIILSLDSIKQADFSEEQYRRLFTRPQPQRVKHVYKFDKNCNVVEQQ